MRNLFKHTLIGLSSFSLVIFSTFVSATTLPQPEDVIRKTLEERIGNAVKVDSVMPSSVAGLYEIRIGAEIFYTDEKAENLIIGQIKNLKTGKNYTQERLDTLAVTAVFSPTNKVNALKLVKGNGKREVVVFEDANCGYCKKLRSELEKLTDITIYTYLIPILAKDSEVKMRGVWCAKDRNKTYDDWMLRGTVPPVADERCAVPVDENQALARSLQLRGTPIIFFSNGKRVPGYIDAAQIEQNLTEIVTMVDIVNNPNKDNSKDKNIINK